MKKILKNDIDDFLKKTEYCDYDNKEIEKKVFEIIKGCKTDKEKAVKLFYWVRDGIFYRVGLWQRKASETLSEKSGTCTNKANLLVAMLRLVKIPSGYGVMKVKGQEYFGPIAIPMLKRRISKESWHFYCIVRLNNKWIKCDPSDDKEFCKKTSYFNATSSIVDWNGENDSLINFNKNHIIEDNFPVDSIDNFFKKKPKNSKGIISEIGNLYIKFLRNNKEKIKNPDDLEFLFKTWLKKNYFFYYIFFLIVSFFYDFKKICFFID